MRYAPLVPCVSILPMLLRLDTFLGAQQQRHRNKCLCSTGTPPGDGRAKTPSRMHVQEPGERAEPKLSPPPCGLPRPGF